MHHVRSVLVQLAVLLASLGLVGVGLAGVAAAEEPRRYTETLDMNVPPIQSDLAVRYDYDLVYVRAPRHGNERSGVWAEVLDPTRMEPGSDLMLLHPDGSLVVES